jgi:glycosyltransferase involved in cell wall biosynthesis
MRGLINEIYDINPLFVWSMGDTFLFPDLFRRYTTVLTQRFSKGCPIAEGSILLDYLGHKIDNNIDKYLFEHNQNYIHMPIKMPIKETGIQYYRKDFKIPEEAFVIGIVGNRLDVEVTEKFLDLLEDMILKDKEKKIFFLFIGGFNKYLDVTKDRLLLSHSEYIGFHDDLLGVLKITDLFLNPPRKGGGTGAIWAIYQGVPVITLDNCDIASCVGKDFICNDINEMTELVLNYIQNKEFYNRQSQKASEVGRNMVDMSLELDKLIVKVKALI